MNQIENDFDKIFSPNLIPKSLSRRLSWFLEWKIYSEDWKYQIFDKSALSCLTRCEKFLWRGSLGCKKVLKFTCLTMKFHGCHHTNLHTQKVSNHRWTHCRNIESISTYKDQFQASDHKIRASNQVKLVKSGLVSNGLCFVHTVFIYIQYLLKKRSLVFHTPV